MHFTTLTSIAIFLQTTLAFPHLTPDNISNLKKRAACLDVQIPRSFNLPPALKESGLKKIPDEDHPFRAPGPNDTRGPCPGLNTLANHGYIDRSGVDTAENIIQAAMEGFNMERDFAAFATALAVLARGNANTATVSIGHPSPQVPPLPGCIDGNIAGGLATSGRFEGDVSITRVDHTIGNNVDLDQAGYNRMLKYIGIYGDDGPEGPKTVINVKTVQELKYDIFNEDQKIDRGLEYSASRQLTAFAEAAILLELMADGRTGTSTLQQLNTFFLNQTFGPDFYRRSGPAGITELAPITAELMNAHPIPYGHNDKDGNYVVDQPETLNFPCDGYTDLVVNLPSALMGQSGIFKKNVDAFVDALSSVFTSCPKAIPNGRNGV